MVLFFCTVKTNEVMIEGSSILRQTFVDLWIACHFHISTVSQLDQSFPINSIIVNQCRLQLWPYELFYKAHQIALWIIGFVHTQVWQINSHKSIKDLFSLETTCTFDKWFIEFFLWRSPWMDRKQLIYCSIKQHDTEAKWFTIFTIIHTWHYMKNH